MATITLTVNGERVEMSVSEARRLYGELRDVFGDDVPTVPTYTPPPWRPLDPSHMAPLYAFYERPTAAAEPLFMSPMMARRWSGKLATGGTP